MSVTSLEKDRQSEFVLQRSAALLREQQQSLYQRTDHMFVTLLLLQWLGGIAASIWISPRTWAGATSDIHLHLWGTILLGGAVVSVPVLCSIIAPGKVLTRHLIAISQMLMCALLIHLSGGRMESHFHIFGSLAFLACYRDWRVLITATIVISCDHLLRGLFWPESVYGLASAPIYITLEHVGWVIFEDIFLIFAICHSTTEMGDIAVQRASLEATNQIVEREVERRTDEINRAHQELIQRSSELQKSEAQIRTIMQHVGEGIMTFSETGRIESFNTMAEQMFGFSLSEIKNRNVAQLMPDEQAARFLQSLQCYCETGLGDIIGTQQQLTGQHKSGRRFPIESKISEVFLNDRRLFVGIVRDISERLRAAEKLEHIQSMLSQTQKPSSLRQPHWS